VKWLKWIFWSAFYAFRRQPKDMFTYLVRGERTRVPWWKFEPCVWHNKDGNMWHVRLTDEEDYVVSWDRQLRVSVHLGLDGHTVVGFDVFDESLNELVR
jgi:hypothetical protein